VNLAAISTIAGRELKKSVFNAWLPLVGGILLIANLVLARMGFSFAGDESAVDTRAMLLSMVHLQMYAVPLFAFVLSYAGVLAEREQGTLDLLLSYPIAYRDLILGKWAGFCLTVSIPVVTGIAAVGLSTIGRGIPIGTLVELALLSVVLSCCCVSIGLALSCIARDRTAAIAACIATWVLFVFVFDLVFVFVQVATEGSLSDTVAQAFLLLNPAEAFRVAAILRVLPVDAEEIFGLGSGVLSTPTCLLALGVWIAAPTAYAIATRRRWSRGQS
jgi:Cu-processing system permease protein